MVGFRCVQIRPRTGKLLVYRVVLDTNVLISAIITDGKPRRLVRKAKDRGQYVLLTSPDILAETVRVLRRSKFTASWAEITRILSRSDSMEILVPQSKFRVVQDPDDDIVINVAYDGHADYIVSGD